MNSEQSKQIENLAQSALERPAAERDAFLRGACGGDAALEREVKSLLGSRRAILEDLIGHTISHYRIVGKLGAGGMGVVYKAEDTRLHRFVALKILPDDFARDAARRRRFEQEARVVAALNHPNIVAVYDVGQNFLVGELVDGTTLRHAANLMPRQAIDVAVQIAEGLGAAHAAGITHRDLKPENIMIARDGRVKILDFGLAKITQPPPLDSPASLVTTQTQEGVIMGTIGYMSPEQVRGQPADHRSDIFSFGLVLYEMLAGHRAFAGASPIEILNGILKDDPRELPESIGTGIRRIVERCLNKNPDRRFQSARDLAFALETASVAAPQIPTTAPLQSRKVGLLGAAGAVAIAIVALGASYLFWGTSVWGTSVWDTWRTPAPAKWTGVMLGGPEIAIDSRLSPDGHLLAFLAMVDGLTQIAVMKPESGNWTILTRDRTRGQASAPSWSPDGAVIYYNRSNGPIRGLYSVPVLGGDEHLVLDDAGNSEALPDGTLIVVRPGAERKRALHRFWPGTGRLQPLDVQTGLTSSENTASRAYPDGKTVLIWGQPAKEATTHTPSPLALYALDLFSGSTKRLSPAALNSPDVTAFAVAADGQSVLVAVNSGTLTRIVSFPASGAATERPLFTVTATVWFLDAGPDGSVYASMFDRPSELGRFSVDGTRYEKLASFPVVPEDPAIMTLLPDGRAVVAVRASGQNRLMVVQKGKDPAVLVNTTEETMAPVSTCGSREVAFMIGPAPHETIAFTEPASGRVVRKIAPGKGPVDSISCSPDGATLYFSARAVIWSMPSSGGEARKVREGWGVVSDPSRRGLIVKVMENSQERLLSVPLDGSPEHEIPLDSSIRLQRSQFSASGLSADGRLLVPLSPRDSWFNPPGVIDTATGRITRIPSDNQGDYRSLGWTRDGQVIALKNGLRATMWKFQPSAR